MNIPRLGLLNRIRHTLKTQRHSSLITANTGNPPFLETLEPRLLLSSTVEGIVWNDINENGFRDQNEPGLPGWTVYADMNQNGQLDQDEPSAITSSDDPITIDNDESGHYQLQNLEPGSTAISLASIPTDWHPLNPGYNELIGQSTLSTVQTIRQDTPESSKLDSPNSIILSPDENFIYIAGFSKSISIFARNPYTETLVHLKDVVDGESGVFNLSNVTAFQISANGTDLYALAYNSNSILHFKRSLENGHLDLETVYENGINGTDWIGNISTITLSPDQKYFYIGTTQGQIFVLNREQQSGDLTYHSSYLNHNEGHPAFDAIESLVVSPDNRHLYVGSFGGDRLTVLNRNMTNGQLEFNSTPTTQSPTGLPFAREIQISQNGLNLYAITNSGVITTFNRNLQTGSLTYLQYVSHHDNSIYELYNIKKLELSNNGRYLYASSQSRDSLVVLERDINNGLLTFDQAISDNEAGIGLNNASTLAVTADGRGLYLLSSLVDTVTTLTRTAPASQRMTILQNQVNTDINFSLRFIDDNYDRAGNDAMASSYDISSLNGIALSDHFGVGFIYDEDWYQFQIPEDQPGFSIELIQDQIDSTSHMTIFDSNGVPLNAVGKIIHLDLSPGTYFVLIDGDFHGQSYDLKWESGLDDAYDLPPNDTLQDAFDLRQYDGQSLSDINGKAKLFDEDWYLIQVDQQKQAVEITLNTDTINNQTLFELYNPQGQLIAVSQTIDDAQYLYSQLTPGDYYIKVFGDFSDQTYDITWNSNQLPTAHGTVWLDFNEDGIRDEGEPGLSGWTLYVDQNRNRILDPDEPFTQSIQDDPLTQDIDESGQYQFNALPIGNVVIAQVQQTRWVTSTPAYNIQTGTGKINRLAVYSEENGLTNTKNMYAVKVSPNGKFVYATSLEDDTLHIFRRNAQTGHLTHGRAYINNTSGLSTLDAPKGIAISQDSQFVYVMGSGDHAINIFQINPDSGLLTFVDAVINNANGVQDLNNPHFIKLSPDGLNAYAISPGDDTIAHFQRNPTDGTLAYIKTYYSNTDAANMMNGPTAIDITPDGEFMYVTAGASHAINTFAINSSDGSLSYVNSITDPILDNVHSITVSPDGTQAFVSNIQTNSMAVYQRDLTTGSLTETQRFIQNTNGVSGLNKSWQAIISNDGERVYNLSRGGSDMAIFERDTETGILTFIESFVPNPEYVPGAQRPVFITISPDDLHLYVANENGNSIAALAIDAHQAYEVNLDLNESISYLNFGNHSLDDFYDYQHTDTRETAYDLTPYPDTPISEIHGQASLYDDDWFKITIPENTQLLEIVIESELYLSDFLYEVYHQNTKITPYITYTDNQTTFSIDTTLSGDYYIRIFGPTDGEQYNLTWNYATSPQVNGIVWYDANLDQQLNPNENGLPGRVVFADLNRNNYHDNNEPFTVSQQDDPNTPNIDETGFYQITDLPLGQVDIRQIIPAQWGSTTPTVIVQSGTLNQSQATNLTEHGLSGGYAIDLSPDGKNVYVTATRNDSFGVFAVNNTDNSLTFIQKFQSGQNNISTLDQPSVVKVSQDGKFVYVGGRFDGAISIFTRDPNNGSLDPNPQIVDNVNGVDALRGITDFIISKDGQYLYAASDLKSTVSVFARNRTTGSLTFLQSFDNNDHLNLTAVNGLALTPDQNHLYTSGPYRGAITHFTRNPETGLLTYVQSVSPSNSGNGFLLLDMTGIQVHRSGQFLYAASSRSDAIALLDIDPITGSLTLKEIYRNDIDDIEGLNEIASIKLTQDGYNLYAVAEESEAILSFQIDQTTGQLIYTDTIYNNVDNVTGLDGVSRITLNPDGTTLYATSLNDNRIVSFGRSTDQAFTVNLTSGQIINDLNFGSFFLDDPFDLESNDTLHTATDFTNFANGSLSQLAGYANLTDDDWYAVQLADPARVLEITLTQLSGEQQLTMQIYNSAESLIYDSSEEFNDFQSIHFDSDIYYIRITGIPEEQLYDLEWKLIPTPHVTGIHFHDINQNGFRNNNEPGLAGMKLYADLNRNGYLDPNEPTTITREDDPTTPLIDETGMFELPTRTGEHYIAVADRIGWKTAYPDPTAVIGEGELAAITPHINGQNTTYGSASYVTQSSAGTYLYTADQNTSTVNVYERNALTGQIEWVQSITESEVSDLGGAKHISVSPDGKFLYVSCFRENTLVIFSIDEQTGELNHIDTISNNGTSITNIDRPITTTITEDGQSLYLANSRSDSIMVFSRDNQTGLLTFTQTLANNENGITGLEGPRDITLSPDEAYMYVAGFDQDTIVIFKRNTQDGNLTYNNTLHNNVMGITGLTGVSSITISQNGLYAYTTGLEENAITVFSRNIADGMLTYKQLYRHNVLGTHNLEGVIDLTISPDGKDLYAASSATDAIAHFNRDPVTGLLTYHSAVINVEGELQGLDGVQSLIISPDGKHLYAASFISTELTSWSIFYTTQVHEVDLELEEVKSGLLFGSRQPADVNRSGNADAQDIDLVYSVLLLNFYLPNFDVNEDGALNQGDVDFAVREMFGSEYGDANLDRVVNLEDLALLATHFGQSDKGWAQGDYTGDKTVNLEDLAILAEHFGKVFRPAESMSELAGDGTGGVAAVTQPSEQQSVAVNSVIGKKHGEEAIWMGESMTNQSAADETAASPWSHIHSLLDESDDEGLM